MSSTESIHVSDTAFVTCAFRRLNESLSQDPYAKFWCNDKAELIVKDYLNKVSTEEVQTHCIRNRYFLEELKALIAQHKIEVLINFGAGFSMYPFLLDEQLIHIEIDKPEVVDYKSQQISQWVSEKELPQRHINFIGVDFSTNYREDLLSKINTLKGNKPCFVLLEGVLFFLNKTEADKLFDLFKTIQHPKDYIGSVSYTDAVHDTKAYKRLLKYASKELDDASDQGFQTIENSFYETLAGYKLIDHQDYYSCSKLYGNTPKCDKIDILNEHFYILQKQ
jgi:O-methyltransferase involved in polyketide biosynthesis